MTLCCRNRGILIMREDFLDCRQGLIRRLEVSRVEPTFFELIERHQVRHIGEFENLFVLEFGAKFDEFCDEETSLSFCEGKGEASSSSFAVEGLVGLDFGVVEDSFQRLLSGWISFEGGNLIERSAGDNSNEFGAENIVQKLLVG